MTHFSELENKVVEWIFKNNLSVTNKEKDNLISAITELLEKIKCPNCNKNIKIE